jgi:hypothetical protein
MSLGKGALKVLLVMCLTCAAVWCAWSLRRGTRVTVEVSSSVGGRLQVFWRKSGQDYAEARSLSQPMRKGNVSSRLEFLIPVPWPAEIRFDPGSEPGDVTIDSVRISSLMASRTLRGQELVSALHVRSDIASLQEENGAVHLHLSGNDPNLVMTVPPSVYELLVLSLLVVFSLFASIRALTQPSRDQVPYCGDACQERRATLNRAVLALFAIGFVSSVALKLHGSSLHMWLQHYPNLFMKSEGPLMGAPRAIRSDEWLVYTPGAVSQTKTAHPYGQQNLGLGAGATPLLLGVPTDHITTLFRPQLWGYFLFDAERGYAWFWSYRIFTCLCGVYLLLRLLTRGQVALPLVGSVWFFYSPFVQWWMSSTVPDMAGNVSLALCSLFLAVTAVSPVRVVLGALGLFLFATSFALQLYPPFQIPLVWLGIALIPTLVFCGLNLEDLRRYRALKIFAVSLAGFGVLGNVALYLSTVWESLSVLSHTAYPGARSVQGGGVSLARYFLGFAAFLMNEQSVPQAVGNISEGSTFLLVWPVALVVGLFSLSRQHFRKLAPLACYLVFLSIYVVHGWPNWVSKVTLMNLVPSERVFIGLGLANVIFTVMVLAALERVSWSSRIVGGAVMVVLASILPVFGEVVFGEFLDGPDYILCGVVLASLCLPILLGNRVSFAAAVLVISVVSSGRVNPVVRGLGPLVRNHVTEAISEVPPNLRNRTWLVYGGFVLPQLFKAAGLEVVTGSKFVPQLSLWRLLDPSERYRDVYNRYAHFQFAPAATGEVLQMDLVQADLVTVTVSPCAGELARAGIDVVVMPKSQITSDLTCMTKVPSKLDQRGFFIYARTPTQ